MDGSGLRPRLGVRLFGFEFRGISVFWEVLGVGFRNMSVHSKNFPATIV